MATDYPYEKLTISELKDQLRLHGIRGYTGMSKSDLINVLRNPPPRGSPPTKGSPGYISERRLTVPELKEQLRALGVRGTSGKNKSELEKLLIETVSKLDQVPSGVYDPRKRSPDMFPPGPLPILDTRIGRIGRPPVIAMTPPVTIN